MGGRIHGEQALAINASTQKWHTYCHPESAGYKKSHGRAHLQEGRETRPSCLYKTKLTPLTCLGSAQLTADRGWPRLGGLGWLDSAPRLSASSSLVWAFLIATAEAQEQAGRKQVIWLSPESGSGEVRREGTVMSYSKGNEELVEVHESSFCKRPYGKYFWLLGPHCFCYHYSALWLQHERSHTS